MRIFSYGQFDVEYKEYVFDPSRGKNGRFKPKTKKGYPKDKITKVPIKHSSLVFLEYDSSKTLDPDIKHFVLRLIRNEELLEKKDGIITRTGFNEIYEAQVKHMLRRAIELSRIKMVHLSTLY